MPWRIPEAEIDRIKRETDLVALVQSRGLELRKHGTKDFIGRCPFHADNQTPNFIVTPDKGLWHCMACGLAGNAIQFVQRHDGISFRHAHEVLKNGAAFTAHPCKRLTTVSILSCPLDADADDVTLTRQVVTYYHERLLQSVAARAYLASRGLDSEALIKRFQMGFADRTLGLRLPDKNRREGDRLRARLTQLGLWRESGHEHFNGCVVVPFHNEAGHIVSLYGRRITRGEIKHLYPPGPHRGLFNVEAFQSSEIILCEAVLDALTFYTHGFTNVSALFGTEGFTEELWQAVRKAKRVLIAYDADDAGERAAERDVQKFRTHGIEAFRIKFPLGMDANEYGNAATTAEAALRLKQSVVSAEPFGFTKSAPLASPERTILSLAASVSSLEPATKKESAVAPPSVPVPAILQHRDDAWFLELEGREYRVSGLEKTIGTDGIKITLRLRWNDRFHLDQLDVCRDLDRRRFVERAAEETGLMTDLLKRDMGRLLLAVEQAQVELGKPQEKEAAIVALSAEEKEETLTWLRAPDLVLRLREAFRKTGIVGEESNALVAYLACVSRKLERPLAIIIQSASAAGKTTLMDAVLNFFPEEERVKYSAMTGQSLYYLGETNLKHKILAVVEEAGAEKASYALKLLQSEGELTIASTGKDPATGKMVTQEYHVEGPVMIFLTTTAIDMDEELQNRCLTLAVDESAEQTGRIHELQREKRTLAGLVVKEERKNLLRQLRNAQRLLAPVDIINPYAPALTFPTARTRNRRDHEKYLTLIDAIALLHQHQRTRRTVGVMNGERNYIEVTLEDIALANQLAPEILGRSLDELPPQTRRLLGHIRTLLKERKTAGAKMGAGTACFSRRELREFCGWSLTQVRVHLERLVDLEYLAIRQGRLGSQFLYELLQDLDTPEAIAHIGLIDAEQLRHTYKTNLAGFPPSVAEKNGHLAANGQTGPPAETTQQDASERKPDGLMESRIWTGQEQLIVT